MQHGLHTAETASERLSIVPLTPDRYAEWDEFCLASPDAWFWHTSQWLEYTLRYRPDLQPRSESFLCLHEGSVVAVCPLIVETHAHGTESIREFSYGGDAEPAPALAGALPEKARKEVLQRVFAHVDELAGRINIARASFRMSPLAPSFWNSPFQAANPLLRLGFSDISLATQVIDLSQDEEALRHGMRSEHRLHVNRASKSLETTVLDAATATQEQFDQYRVMHRRAAGRVTRPIETFQMMYGWIRAGSAILCSASLQGKAVGFILVSLYKDGAYYSSGCRDLDHGGASVGHLLQWRTIQWLKQQGVRRYEVGIQVYANQPHAMVSERELSIALFKRGFGGVATPLWRGEKFYDRSYCLATLRERAEKYAATIVA